MKVLKIDHLGIAVNSIDEGKNFWTDVMGLDFEGTDAVYSNAQVVDLEHLHLACPPYAR